MQRAPSALNAFYGTDGAGDSALEFKQFSKILDGTNQSLSTSEIEAAMTLHSLLSGLSMKKDDQPTAKTIQVPDQTLGMIQIAKKRDHSHLDSMASLAQASNLMREKENSLKVQIVSEPKPRIAAASPLALSNGRLSSPAQRRAVKATQPLPRTSSLASLCSLTSSTTIEDRPLQREPSSDSVVVPGALERADSGNGKSRYSAFRKASTCPYCAEIGFNCGKVAAKCPNRPCNKCGRRHRLNRCKRTHCKHCLKEDHLSSKCPVKLKEWARASVKRRREQRLKMILEKQKDTPASEQPETSSTSA